MAFTFTWAWYNSSGTAWINFAAGNLIGFYGSTTYGDKITTTEYQDGMHLRTASGTDTDACAADHMRNVKYINSGNCSIDAAANEVVTNIADTECVRIHFTDTSTSVATENAEFYAYASGGTDADAPPNVTVQALECGDAAWTAAGGNGSAVSITNDTAAVDHYYYVAMSASPDTVGEKTNYAWKITLDYY